MSSSSELNTTASTAHSGNKGSPCSDEHVPVPRTLLDRWRGWRGILCRSVLSTLFGLTLNIALLVYSGRFYEIERQSAVLFTGDCNTVSIANTAAHVGVNVLATLLVSAASNTINYLTAPSRADLNRLHASGNGVEVGIWDLRNWKVMSPLRKVLFCCAVLSSVPLHLFYNSIFTVTYTPDDWVGFVVPQSFAQGAAWDASLLNSTWPEAMPVLTKIQQNATNGRMQRLDISTCKKILEVPLVLNYSTILFVTSSDDALGSSQSLPSLYVQHDSVANTDIWTVASQSDTSQFTSDHYRWMDLWENSTKTGSSHNQTAVNLSAVDYCLLQPQPEQCSIQLVPQLIVPVVLFNFLGALAGAIIFFRKSFEPLATFGDAVSSFFARPDPHALTRPLTDIQHGRIRPLVSTEVVEDSFKSRKLTRLASRSFRFSPKAQDDSTKSLHWHTAETRWHSAVSKARWVWTSLLFTLYWLSGLIGVAIVLANSGNPSVALSQGLRSPLPPSKTSPPLILNYNNPLGNIVLANVFQLVLATNYLFYQNILARMALGAEFSRFASQRNTLRVSNPTGKQRSGYFFLVPHRLALALLAVSAFLHFLISEAIFYEQLRPRVAIPAPESFGTDFNITIMHTVVCNPEALLIFEAVGLLAPVLAFAFGWLRRYDSAAPLITGDSRVIAALSTHRKGVSGESEALEELQWGVIEETKEGGYVGFSSAAVQRLVSGKVYRLG